MATLAQFRAYAPELAALPDTIITPALEQGTRWTARVAAVNPGVTLAPADRQDAESAYAIHWLAGRKLLLAPVAPASAPVVKRVELADRGAISYDSAPTVAGASLSLSAEEWLCRAWDHLHDAGLPRGVRVRSLGAVR